MTQELTTDKDEDWTQVYINGRYDVALPSIITSGCIVVWHTPKEMATRHAIIGLFIWSLYIFPLASLVPQQSRVPISLHDSHSHSLFHAGGLLRTEYWITGVALQGRIHQRATPEDARTWAMNQPIGGRLEGPLPLFVSSPDAWNQTGRTGCRQELR